MTAQFPDKLVNKHPRVRLNGFHLYGVIRGDFQVSRGGWGDRDAFTTRPIPQNDAILCSALWHGHVKEFALEVDGRLRLTAFHYAVEGGHGPPETWDDANNRRMSFLSWRTQRVDELLVGDFWVVVKPDFNGQRTYIPFRDSVIVEDRSEWFTEEPFEVRMQRRRAAQQDAEPGAAPDPAT